MTDIMFRSGQPDYTALLPVAIDYPASLALRQMAAIVDDFPKYLLAPDVSALLHYVPDLQRKIWLRPMCRQAFECGTAILAAPARRFLNSPRCEDRSCLPGQDQSSQFFVLYTSMPDFPQNSCSSINCKQQVADESRRRNHKSKMSHI